MQTVTIITEWLFNVSIRSIDIFYHSQLNIEESHKKIVLKKNKLLKKRRRRNTVTKMNSQASHATSSSTVAAKRRHTAEPVPVHIFGKQVLADMESLCMDQLFSDITFLVEDQRLPAHRMILGKRSNYFYGLLYGGMSESKQDVIRLEVPLEAFKIILGYLYSGTLPISQLDVNAIFKVLGLANMYGLLEVETAISEHLRQNLDVSNVCMILDTARQFNLADLTMKCLNFVDRNTRPLLAHESFQMLSKESLEEVLRRDTLIAHELQIFRMVCKWSSHNRNEDIKSLVSLVRLPLISLQDLLNVVHPSGIIHPDAILYAIKTAFIPSNLAYRAAVHPLVNVASETQEARRLTMKSIEIVKLKFWCIINNIGVGSTQNALSLNCTVEVACNITHWVGVGNIRFTTSKPTHNIHFARRPVRYIRIVHPESGRMDILKDMPISAILNTQLAI
ncbi:BTB/POZ domain-containing protein 9-like isoform X1 [Drosophila pseudoobscura]|uniref:BTB/POZ domain-containing protein 9-like isoform X1 n=1 Tax=Drosophila pseudoobscura pseudoobscura TaxID=46245 RepID=A0A6I8V7K3_DROPS|nr:BTB/POZ domain-containing protein 9 isoform X1 [Drosophila pseudoobscura]